MRYIVVILPINRYCERDVLDQLDVLLCLVSIKVDFSCNAVEESIVYVGSLLETQLDSSGTGDVTKHDRGQLISRMIEISMCSFKCLTTIKS